MTTRRFQVTPVPEPIHEVASSEPPEIIPLIHIENEIPQPPPLPASLISTNGRNTNRISAKLLNTFLRRKSLDARRRATVAAAAAAFSKDIKKSSSADVLHQGQSISTPPDSTTIQSNFTVGNEVEDGNVYSSIQSNNYDSNPLRITNKFLQELLLKRRELRDKAKNISIEQRIAFNRRGSVRRILRAQDIFDVHFELDEEDNDKIELAETNLFTEESQEKIRNDIYNELNRQRMKQYHKHHRHVFLGRSLLMLMTSLLAFMSLTLIYVVIDIINRASDLEAKLPDSEFIPMANDKSANFY